MMDNRMPLSQTRYVCMFACMLCVCMYMPGSNVLGLAHVYPCEISFFSLLYSVASCCPNITRDHRILPFPRALPITLQNHLL